ncbi:hypothetical protein HUJ04_011339 [Dendroctonus ponderosae]|nr:hypothetical protein HUJ04_011339 [Dendroctonus ponderosae]
MIFTQGFCNRWIIELAKKGFPRKKKDITSSVQQFLKTYPRPNPFNNDSQGIICTQSGKFLAPKGCKNIYTVDRGSSKENITVMFTLSADGNTCSPMVVLPYQTIPERVAMIIPEGWGIGRKSLNDGSTKELYQTRLHEKIESNSILDEDDAGSSWNQIQPNVLATANEAIGKRKCISLIDCSNLSDSSTPTPAAARDLCDTPLYTKTYPGI